MCIRSQSSRGYRMFSLRTFNMLVRSTGQKLKSEIISKGFQNFAKIWTMSSGHTLRQILPTSVKDLLTKRKKVPKSWRSHQDTNMIFLKVCPESNDLCWKFPKDRLCYFLCEHYEMSAKLHLLRMSVCLFLYDGFMKGPSPSVVFVRASCCYSLEKSSKICGGRSLKAGRGRQGRPNNAQARPNTHHLPPQYSVHVFTQITNSLLKSTLQSAQ